MELLTTLINYAERGLLVTQTHNELPLSIWKYARTVQYEGAWDEITTMSRGLVVDTETGAIIARPFKKFFNIEEGKHTPTKDFIVYDKVDGSLGIVFFYRGEWYMATQGSFHSTQAVRGKEMFDELNIEKYLDINYTYLFEIIYDENRIVVRYGEDKLVLLGKIHTDTGFEGDIEEYRDKMEVVRTYDFDDYTTIQNLDWENSEGFIVKFSNGDRCKIKFANYVRLHSIITNTTSYTVWEALRCGDSFKDFLNEVPDEFYDWVKTLVAKLNSKYVGVKKFVVGTVNSYEGLSDKEFALEILNNKETKKYSGLLFSYRKGKDINDGIWKMLKPEYEKPFSDDE